MWVTSDMAAHWLQSTYHVEITAAAIRKWAERGHLRRRYDLWEVVEVAQARGLIE